ncbi:hypothetical protein FISHEDRAFT_33745 [Fistulina hepatica ATCC 64428]|uniref:Uncharacterized protein n=1 Tax=Fistulina hepatica ATCC 64428 TaxID=1128425 RepID=A0A0D7AQX2_9AGAR|nr:hypothetical protein FISHEDRAFT_33745 [Fistulina hepatica ATCC 64428]
MQELLDEWRTELVTPILTFILLTATMWSVLIVMLIVLVFFSSRSLRKRPIFTLNVLAILAGIACGIVALNEYIHVLKYPTATPDSALVLADECLVAIIPVLVDAILILRLHYIFPPHRTHVIVRLAVLGIPIVVELGRLANVIFYMVKCHEYLQELTSDGSGSSAVGALTLMISTLPCVTIEWVLQLFNNLYVHFSEKEKRIFIGHLRPDSAPVYFCTEYRDKDISSKAHVRVLFWISVCNFVFPLFMAIVQLAVYLAEKNATDTKYLIAFYIQQVNMYFTIIGVVFATIWVAEDRWNTSRGHFGASLPYTTQL